MTDRQLMQMALEALEAHADFGIKADKAITSLQEALAEQPAQQGPVLQDIEQYRMQIAGICTAAAGYWKEGDGICPDYDTLALRDVAKLYAKYDALYKTQPAQQAQPEPMSFEEWDAMQHGDPEEIGFLQALRIAYCAGQDSVTRAIKAAHGIKGKS